MSDTMQVIIYFQKRNFKKIQKSYFLCYVFVLAICIFLLNQNNPTAVLHNEKNMSFENY